MNSANAGASSGATKQAIGWDGIVVAMPPRGILEIHHRAGLSMADIAISPEALQANIASALHLSDRFWLDNLDSLTQRFNTWVSR